MMEIIVGIFLYVFLRGCIQMAIKQGNTEKRYVIAKKISDIFAVTMIALFILMY